MRRKNNIKNKTVGLIFGGLSNESDISVISAKNIIKNFDYDKYDLVLIYWHRNKHFYLLNSVEEIKNISEKNQINADYLSDYSRKIRRRWGVARNFGNSRGAILRLSGIKLEFVYG